MQPATPGSQPPQAASHPRQRWQSWPFYRPAPTQLMAPWPKMIEAIGSLLPMLQQGEVEGVRLLLTGVDRFPVVGQTQSTEKEGKRKGERAHAGDAPLPPMLQRDRQAGRQAAAARQSGGLPACLLALRVPSLTLVVTLPPAAAPQRAYRHASKGVEHLGEGACGGWVNGCGCGWVGGRGGVGVCVGGDRHAAHVAWVRGSTAGWQQGSGSLAASSLTACMMPTPTPRMLMVGGRGRRYMLCADGGRGCTASRRAARLRCWLASVPPAPSADSSPGIHPSLPRLPNRRATTAGQCHACWPRTAAGRNCHLVHAMQQACLPTLARPVPHLMPSCPPNSSAGCATRTTPT